MKYSLLKKFLEGGQLPAEEAAAQAPEEGAQAQGGDQAIMQAAQQVVESLMLAVGDPQAVAAILQAALEMVASAAQEAQPTFQRKGGRLVRK